MLLIMAGMYYKVKRIHNIAKGQSSWYAALIHHPVPKVGSHINNVTIDMNNILWFIYTITHRYFPTDVNVIGKL